MILPDSHAGFPPLTKDYLTGEKISPVRWSKVAFDLLLTLLLVLLFNLAAYFFLGHYTVNYGFWVAKEKWRILDNMERPVDWLVLGDSSANQGVIPAEIERLVGERSINLGTFGDMVLVDDLWMLENYLERFGAPEKVVVVHVFDMWQRSFNPVLLSQVPLPWGYWERYMFSSEWVPEEVEQDIFIERYFPIYTQNRSLGAILRASLMEFRSPLNNRLTIDDDGFFPAYEAKPDIVRLGALDQISFIHDNSFAISSINKDALVAMIGLAQEHGFDLYLLNSPLVEDLYQSDDFQAYRDEMQRQLEVFDAGSERFHYVAEIKTFPAEQMQTTDHLIVSGAVEYTRWLVEKVKER